jgi:hypothetical protein
VRITGELAKKLKEQYGLADAKQRTRTGRGQRTPGEMNKLERAYSEHLEQQRYAGEILEWHFEAVKLKLATATFYTPDFMVMLPDGLIEFAEVKGGYFYDDAKVKLKVAAKLFPFRFRLVKRQAKKDGGKWLSEEVAA